MIVRPAPFAVGENPHTGYVASNLDNLLRLADRDTPVLSALEGFQEPLRQGSAAGHIAGKIDDPPVPADRDGVAGVAVTCSFEVSENASPRVAVDPTILSLEFDGPVPVKASHQNAVVAQTSAEEFHPLVRAAVVDVCEQRTNPNEVEGRRQLHLGQVRH